jgi:4-coumarate--CoA ligase
VEWPRAYVALTDEAKDRVTTKSLQDWMKIRVSKHKWLEGGIAFVEEVPKLASGKIQRKVVRDWAIRDAAIIEGNERAKL